jgi:hypothetical protein
VASLLAGAWLLGPPSSLSAQLPVPKVASIFPPGLAAGATNLLTVTGTELDEPITLHSPAAGIRATPRTNRPGEFTVIIPANLPPGLTELSFSGRFGRSLPRPFFIGDGPEFVAPATNTGPASAIPLPFATAVYGRVYPNTAAWFRFEARAGQRVLVRVQARELASRLVPELLVADANGRELALIRRRELLDFTAPSDGVYQLRLNDQTYRGGDDYHYRLTLSAGPHLELALPTSLRIGETNRVTLFGRNLPGGSPLPFAAPDGGRWETLAVELVAPTNSGEFMGQFLGRPAAANLTAERFRWRLTTTNGPSNPLQFSLTTLPVIATLTHGLIPVVPPVEVSGLFPGPGEVAGVRFAAQKGDVFWLEIFADRLGFPSDPSVLVQRERSARGEGGEPLYAEVLELGDTETHLSDREFNTTTRDAAARFEAPETGHYRVLIRDLFNAAPGRPRYAYRLSLRPETPDFRLVALPVAPPKANNDDRQLHLMVPVLRRGETLPLRVLGFRRDGFTGEIELSATQLPPGVTAATTRIPAGHASGVILLTASEDASGATDVALWGRALVGGTPQTRLAPLVSLLWPVPDYNLEAAAHWLAAHSVVSVCSAELAPVTLAPAEATVFEAPAGGKLVVPLRVTRRGEFQGAFKLKWAGHPELEPVKELSVAEKATHASVELNLAEVKLPAGRHTLWLHGSVSGKYRNQPEAVAAADAVLKAADHALSAAAEKDQPPLAERRKAAAAAKQAAEARAQPRELTVPLYSQPFTVKITPAAPAPAPK